MLVQIYDVARSLLLVVGVVDVNVVGHVSRASRASCRSLVACPASAPFGSTALLGGRGRRRAAAAAAAAAARRRSRRRRRRVVARLAVAARARADHGYGGRGLGPGRGKEEGAARLSTNAKLAVHFSNVRRDKARARGKITELGLGTLWRGRLRKPRGLVCGCCACSLSCG